MDSFFFFLKSQASGLN